MLRENLNIEHHVLPDLYVSFLYNQGGLLVKWFRDTFAVADVPPANCGIYDWLDREIPEEPTRLLVLPHFDPPPHHAPRTSGVIVGLKTDTRRGEILKAIREGTTLYFMRSLEALVHLGIDTNRVHRLGRWCEIRLRFATAGRYSWRALRSPAHHGGRRTGRLLWLAGLATSVFERTEEAGHYFREARSYL